MREGKEDTQLKVPHSGGRSRKILAENERHPGLKYVFHAEPRANRNKPSQSNCFRFLDLPKELRLHVLWFTSLVIPYDTIAGVDDIEICHNVDEGGFYYIKSEFDVGEKNDGSIKQIQIPVDLFTVCKLVRNEATEVLFSKNRITLCCEYGLCLEWLQTVPRDCLRHIRKLDLVIDLPSNLCRQTTDQRLSPSILKSFEMLIDFIAQNLNLSRLFLSLNSRRFRDLTEECRRTGPSKLWSSLTATVQGYLGPSLGQFGLYCDYAPDTEDEWEKAVMGPAYSSREYGKIPSAFRCLRRPHRLDLSRAIAGNLESRAFPEDDGKGLLKSLYV